MMTEFKSLDNWLPVNPTSEDFRSPPIDITVNFPTRKERRRKIKNKQVRERRKKNPEKYRKRAKEYRKNNIKRINEKQAEYRKNNPERYRLLHKKWRENNPDKVKYSKIKYYKDNHEIIRERQAEYRKNNREKIRELFLKRYDKNREKINERNRNRNRIIKQLTVSHYSNNENKCACCGITNNLTIDHVNGGGNEHRKQLGKVGDSFVRWLFKNNYPKGYQVLCMECNASKNKYHQCRIHNKILVEMEIKK